MLDDDEEDDEELQKSYYEQFKKNFAATQSGVRNQADQMNRTIGKNQLQKLNELIHHDDDDDDELGEPYTQQTQNQQLKQELTSLQDELDELSPADREEIESDGDNSREEENTLG